MPTLEAPAAHLSRHPAFGRLFQPGQLTFGFIAPINGYPDGPIPDLTHFADIVRQADEAGIGAIWLRDVPFFDPNFGDAGQVFDPLVYAGWLAASTQNIAIGMAGVVLPLRDPLLVAKQATTIDQLSGGRLLLGLASGDRASEYPAFGLDFANRAERYREARHIIRLVTEESYPQFKSKHYGTLDGQLDLLPKPFAHVLPALAIGRAGQSVEWLAENLDGWLWHGADARHMTDVIPQWQAACHGTYKPYGYASFFDLAADPDEPLTIGRVFLKGGRKALIRFWETQRQAGLSHTLLNLKATRRPASEIIEEFAEFILPQFR